MSALGERGHSAGLPECRYVPIEATADLTIVAPTGSISPISLSVCSTGQRIPTMSLFPREQTFTTPVGMSALLANVSDHSIAAFVS